MIVDQLTELTLEICQLTAQLHSDIKDHNSSTTKFKTKKDVILLTMDVAIIKGKLSFLMAKMHEFL